MNKQEQELRKKSPIQIRNKKASFEPFVGLDPHAIKELKQMMLEMKRQGCAVVSSTHMLDSVEELWDKTLI